MTRNKLLKTMIIFLLFFSVFFIFGSREIKKYDNYCTTMGTGYVVATAIIIMSFIGIIFNLSGILFVLSYKIKEEDRDQ